MKILPILFLLLSFSKLSAQNGQAVLLRGQVSVNGKLTEGVGLLNLRSEAATQTAFDGVFLINVRVGDTLAFMGLQVINKKVKITREIIDQPLFAVVLEPRVHQLEEVEIKDEFKHINALSLGILQTKPKKYTVAQRRLNYVSGFSIEGILASISGRKARLKKELEIEQKEKGVQSIESLFDKTYFTETLHIPEEYVRGFWHYAIDNGTLQAALQSKNKKTAQFIFTDIARQYLENFKSTN